MKPLQTLTLVIGTTAVTCHSLGLLLNLEPLNFIAAFLGRSSAVIYLAALDKFRFYSLIPLIFATLNVVTGDRSYLYLELLSQGVMYQIIAFITFRKLNKNA